jgi:hypothetical protein
LGLAGPEAALAELEIFSAGQRSPAARTGRDGNAGWLSGR